MGLGHRLLQGWIGLSVLIAYLLAAWLALVALQWIVGGLDVATIALGLLLGSVVASYLSYRVGTNRLLAGLRAHELPRSRAPALYRTIDDLVATMDVARPAVLVARMGEPNALSIQRGRQGVIVLDRRLLRVLDHDELAGILAHELAHVEHRDALVKTLALTLLRTLTGLLYVLLLPVLLALSGLARGTSWLAGRPLEPQRGLTGRLWLALELGVAGVLSLVTVLVLAYARRREYAADRRAATVTGDPLALARGLARIERAAERGWGLQSLLTISGNEDRDPPTWLSTHPDITERIERLEAMADEPLPRRIPVE
jgi:heat shock protein HtpX